MTQSTTPKHIVVYADDDPDDLELVREAFTQYSSNVELITFSDGLRALSYLQSLTNDDPSPCLVILDINMPVMSGKEVLIKLRDHYSLDSVPVVLFTTSSQPVDKDFAEKYDAGFITKPLDIRQMEKITEQFINHCTEDTRSKIRKKVQ